MNSKTYCIFKGLKKACLICLLLTLGVVQAQTKNIALLPAKTVKLEGLGVILHVVTNPDKGLYYIFESGGALCIFNDEWKLKKRLNLKLKKYNTVCYRQGKLYALRQKSRVVDVIDPDLEEVVYAKELWDNERDLILRKSLFFNEVTEKWTYAYRSEGKWHIRHFIGLDDPAKPVGFVQYQDTPNKSNILKLYFHKGRVYGLNTGSKKIYRLSPHSMLIEKVWRFKSELVNGLFFSLEGRPVLFTSTGKIYLMPNFTEEE